MRYIAIFLILLSRVWGAEIIENHADDVITYFVLVDQTTGDRDTTVTIANLEIYYVEDQAAESADAFVGAHGAVTDAHTDGECIHMGHGVYRIDWPDEAFDGGVGKRVQLTVVDGDDGAKTETLVMLLSPPSNVTQLDGSDVQQTGGHIHAFDDAGAALCPSGEPLTAQETEDEAIDALESFKLDELMSEAVTTNLNTAVHDNSALGYLFAISDVAAYDRTEDSLQGIIDYGDVGWITATGFAVSGEPLTAQEVEDTVWDAVLTGASHNDATSAGRRLRQTADVTVIREEEEAQAVAVGTITLHDDASAIDNYYADTQVVITSADTGVGQMRHIHSYVGSTRVATIIPDWITTPTGTITYVLRGDSVKHVGQVLDDAITAASIANAAIDAATFAADVDAEFAAYIWNAAVASYGSAGTYGLWVEDILVDTSAYDTDAERATAIWGAVMENSKTYAQVMRVFAAVLSGKSSIATDEFTFVGIDGTTTRLVVTVSAGARTSVDTWDGSE